jgi:superfamily II DNA helicase RecQ
VEYFGQEYEAEACTQGCDICLGEAEMVPDGVVIAQKILSCVARVKEGYGGKYVVSVLRGQEDERVKRLQHDQLSTFGILKDFTAVELRGFIQQLIGQGVLVQTDDEYPILKLNPGSWEVLRKERNVALRSLKRSKGSRKSRAETASWDGVDRDLFETMRGLRRHVATERNVPPYLIFTDDILRELARVRPSSEEKMRRVYGVGDAKLKDLGPRFLPAIAEHCRQQNIEMDLGLEEPPARQTVPTRPAPPSEPAAREDTTWWEGVDRPLFHALRQLQGVLAAERNTLPQTIFHDLTLRDLARVRPSSRERMLTCYGVNEAKLNDYGERFLALVREHVQRHHLTMDNPLGPIKAPKPRSDTPRALVERSQAYDLFRQQLSLEAMIQRTGWSRDKLNRYLVDFIGDEKPPSIAAWVADDMRDRVVAAARRHGRDRLKPLYVALGEQVSYDDIRLVLADMDGEGGITENPES